MDDREFEAHVKCLMSMCLAHLTGKMDRPALTSNLGLISWKMGARMPDQPPKVETCDKCVEWWACDCVEKRKVTREVGGGI